MHVLIATPTAGQLVTTAYTATLVNATKALHEAGLDYHHSTFDGADIVMARNYLANEALRRRYRHRRRQRQCIEKAFDLLKLQPHAALHPVGFHQLVVIRSEVDRVHRPLVLVEQTAGSG